MLKKDTIPVSHIRGNVRVGENAVEEKLDRTRNVSGLVDSMDLYETEFHRENIASGILDFYENTDRYRLFSRVKWLSWFLPFAAVYKCISRITRQINLPLRKKEYEMTGEVLPIQEEVDGRASPRAWIRKIGSETVFVALYSHHNHNGRTYMNIALPLPFSAMTGILTLSEQNNRGLRLTSKREKGERDHSGTYLAIRDKLISLPLEEQFDVHEEADGTLSATHRMWIFSIPFLVIDYRITKKE
ncbi:hypothetical protein [Guptibacillus algicola]|uniref:hypothetical protein n=1 Tax=Guptibacillus algicola TaxID=225844 RepID=UPI001CD6FDDD|nr:hypothetical protein [Alkalihalobacillus algicola]MCA0987390.1 hypothetical protein [Alkalihalobacillus algicola]